MAPLCHRTCMGLTLLAVILFPAHGKLVLRSASNHVVLQTATADLDLSLSSSTRVKALAAKVLSLQQTPWELAKSKADLEQTRETMRNRKLRLQDDYRRTRQSCEDEPLFSETREECDKKLQEIQESIDATQELIDHLSQAIAAWPSSGTR
eukprot:TRINITY_DN10053_c0_g1_i2.p1 TRINITY_DN10053_c0_g1~~TRINITY_DN10053_c0_g1_i2.p1  ORF type:complete len:151 (+),score=25.90 TRINITY_DN10053_c0_g1_i2:81-533(+)